MGEQLVFNLSLETAFGRDDYFVSGSNQLVVAAVENWPNWPQNKLLLCGDAGAGKTHLAHIWASGISGRTVNAADLPVTDLDQLASGATCVENIHRIGGQKQAEAALFHLHNLMQQQQTPLLMTGQGVLSGWGIVLPDLASRLAGSNVVFLPPPDDALLAAVLVKLFNDRQLRVEPGLISYLLPRMERSLAQARALVAALDHQALQDKRPIGVNMARKTLESLQQEPQ
jgi:chromosomal replication initiation ATPase DnaA